MNIEDFRNYCLSLKGVTEKMPFEKTTSEYDRNLLVFSIGYKWFCFVNIEQFDQCVLKSEPNLIQELQDRYEGIRPGYHMNHKHWISVFFNTDVEDYQIRKLVKIAYQIVFKSLPKKDQIRFTTSSYKS